jgi:hypothetical protein
MRQLNNIDPEELDHVLQQFTFKNFSNDMALFFMTQNIDYNDLFKYSSTSNSKFYKDVFTYMLAFMVDKANTGRFTEWIWNITSKMYWTTYRTDNVYPFEDYYTSIFFRDMFKYLLQKGMDILVITTIDALSNNPEVDPKCIVDLIVFNKEFRTRSIITYMMQVDRLSSTDILNLILLEYDRSKNPDTLMILMEEYALTKDYYIDLLDTLKDMYTVVMNEEHNKRYVHIAPVVKSKYNKALDLVKTSITRVINQDADLDIYQKLDEAALTHEMSHDIRRAHLYRSIKDWLVSEERYNTRQASLIWFGYEDNDLILTEDEYKLIASDILINEYMRDDRYLSAYEIFLRVYNLNRFRFLQNEQMYTLRDELISKLYRNGYPVYMALREDIKYLINF